jgi:aspartyl-tRNA(Asn)/glutamyl-tRNA(Gln) amidotransferase subunit C
MSFTQDDVERVAHLARLAISADDVPDYARNLSNILDFVAQMNAVDTTGVLPMAHPLHMPQRLRSDVVTEADQRELFESNAPQAGAGYFLVPKVIE